MFSTHKQPILVSKNSPYLEHHNFKVKKHSCNDANLGNTIIKTYQILSGEIITTTLHNRKRRNKGYRS
jgi:hypothetical protein